MKENTKKIMLAVFILFVSYPMGFVLWVLILIPQALGLMRVIHRERFPHFGEKTFLVSNHRSAIDWIILAGIFFEGYWLHPFKHSPMLVADKKLWYDPWYMFWARPFIIPVERGNKDSERNSYHEIRRALEAGKVVVLFPEGGRTFRCEEFLFSEKGNKLGVLKGGVGMLVKKTGASVVPVWMKGTNRVAVNSKDRKRLWTKIRLSKKTEIRIGKPVDLTSKTGRTKSDEITQKIAGALLRLSDEKVRRRRRLWHLIRLLIYHHWHI